MERSLEAEFAGQKAGAMIPTHHKAKSPRHLSYPVGAETLSEGSVTS
jgi:hypothetical protein